MGRQTKANHPPVRCPKCGKSLGPRGRLWKLHAAGEEFVGCFECKQAVMDAAQAAMIAKFSPDKGLKEFLGRVPPPRQAAVRGWLQKFLDFAKSKKGVALGVAL